MQQGRIWSTSQIQRGAYLRTGLPMMMSASFMMITILALVNVTFRRARIRAFLLAPLASMVPISIRIFPWVRVHAPAPAPAPSMVSLLLGLRVIGGTWFRVILSALMQLFLIVWPFPFISRRKWSQSVRWWWMFSFPLLFQRFFLPCFSSRYIVQ